MGKGKNPGDAQWDIDHSTKRVVFLKYKDALGNKYRRFLGVYSVAVMTTRRTLKFGSSLPINTFYRGL